MDIFARNIKIDGIQLGGSWASGLAIKYKSNIIDIGGGAVHIYEAGSGEKLTTSPLEYVTGLNIRQPINPNNVYFPKDENGKNKEIDIDKLLEIDKQLLDDISNSVGFFIEIKKPPFKAGGRKKSKRRKSKRKRSKRRHR